MGGGDDAPVQPEVPGLELFIARGRVAACQAPVHLGEVRCGRPGHGERHRRRLEQAPDYHHVGRSKGRAGIGGQGGAPGAPGAAGVAGAAGAVRVRPVQAGLAAAGRRGRRTVQVRPAADLAREPALSLQDGQGVPD